MKDQIILYDDQCRLCEAFKNRIELKDILSQLQFIPQGSQLGSEIICSLNLAKKEKNSLIYIENENYYTKSEAVLMIYKRLRTKGFIRRIIALFPLVIRNGVYDLIARYRNKVFK
jgi:predicted DCC family thiol-disulfide oxidoreductase YuxK